MGIRCHFLSIPISRIRKYSHRKCLKNSVLKTRNRYKNIRYSETMVIQTCQILKNLHRQKFTRCKQSTYFRQWQFTFRLIHYLSRERYQLPSTPVRPTGHKRHMFVSFSLLVWITSQSRCTPLLHAARFQSAALRLLQKCTSALGYSMAHVLVSGYRNQSPTPGTISK